MKGPYLLPFCKQYADHLSPYDSAEGANYTTAEPATTPDMPDQRTVWETLHPSCQRSSNVVIAFAGAFVVFCAAFNLLAMFVAVHVKVDESLSTEDEDSVKRRWTYKKSLWSQAMLLCCLAFSGLVASCFLFPSLMVAAYELLSFGDSAEGAERLAVSKQVSNGAFHFVVSFSLYAILGAVCERWVALVRIKPREYLCKVSNPVMALKTKMKLNKKLSDSDKQSCAGSRMPLVVYMLFSLAVSVALAVVSVLYGQERFLLYGDHLKFDQIHPYSSYFTIPHTRIHTMSIVYIILLFAPSVFLVVSFAGAAISLLKTRYNAMQLNSYGQAQALVYFKSRKGSEQKAVKTDRLAKNPSLKIGSGAVKPVSKAENVCYSHKQEHAAQVTSNCQEVDLTGVVTDSIQMQHDTSAGSKTNDTVRLPLPPEWMQFPSIKRCDTISSAVKVDDLATTPLSVPYDSAASFFGELAQTKATLGAYAVVYLLMLPLYSLLAIDVFTDPDGLLGLQMSGYSSLLNDTYPWLTDMYVASFTTTDVSVMLLFLYLFACSLPFVLMLAFSRAYSKAAKSCLRCLCCAKAKPKDDEKEQQLDILKHRPSRGRRQQRANQQGMKQDSRRREKKTPRRSWMSNHAEYWQAFTRRSQVQSERAWQPSQRPRSSYIDNVVNIDERFEADAL